MYSSDSEVKCVQDVDKSDPVGYCDELGRAWLTRNKQSLWWVSCMHGVCVCVTRLSPQPEDRFASTLQDCFVFDSAGRLKHWEWRNIASYSIALPLLLKVNKHVSLRYNSQVSTQTAWQRLCCCNDASSCHMLSLPMHMVGRCTPDLHRRACFT